MTKVFQVGTGKMAKYTMRYVYEKGGEVVGAADINPNVIGKDIGEIMGSENKNVKVSHVDDLERLFRELKPDICIVETMSLLSDVGDVLLVCAKCGVNAVTTCEEAFYSWNSNPTLTSKIDKLAKEGKANIELPKTHFDEDTLDFSFSGIKTAVINLNHKNPNINKADLCASFQKNVTDTLIENVKKAVDKTKIKRIVLAGGVSANSYIREKFLEFERDGIKVYMPDLKLCTDNAAMIASAGYYNFISGKRDKLDLNAVPNIQLGN